jgi:hypothetical protein
VRAASIIEAGRETDVRVAQMLGFVWRRAPFKPSYAFLARADDADNLDLWWPLCGHEQKDTEHDRVPHYSKDIGAAWRVVELFAARGAKVSVMNRYATVWGCMVIQKVGTIDERSSYEIADTASLAICRVAFDAMELAQK